MAGRDETLCARMRPLLPGLLGGDLEGRDLRTLLRHLDVCYDCREERRLIANAMDALRTLPPSERARLRDAALREMALEEEPEPRRFWLIPVLVGVVAFLAIFALAFLKAKSSEQPRTEPTAHVEAEVGEDH